MKGMNSVEQTLELSSKKKRAAARGRIHIDMERCKGCYLCIEACPRCLIEVSDRLNGAGYYPARSKDSDECTACGLCWQMCPDVAIEVHRETDEEEA